MYHLILAILCSVAVSVLLKIARKKKYRYRPSHRI